MYKPAMCLNIAFFIIEINVFLPGQKRYYSTDYADFAALSERMDIPSGRFCVIRVICQRGLQY